MKKFLMAIIILRKSAVYFMSLSHARKKEFISLGHQMPAASASAAAPGACGAKATDNGLFPSTGTGNNIFNNNKADSSFGITTPIFLDQLTPAGATLKGAGRHWRVAWDPPGGRPETRELFILRATDGTGAVALQAWTVGGP